MGNKESVPEVPATLCSKEQTVECGPVLCVGNPKVTILVAVARGPLEGTEVQAHPQSLLITRNQSPFWLWLGLQQKNMGGQSICRYLAGLLMGDSDLPTPATEGEESKAERKAEPKPNPLYDSLVAASKGENPLQIQATIPEPHLIGMVGGVFTDSKEPYIIVLLHGKDYPNQNKFQSPATIEALKAAGYDQVELSEVTEWSQIKPNPALAIIAALWTHKRDRPAPFTGDAAINLSASSFQPTAVQPGQSPFEVKEAPTTFTQTQKIAGTLGALGTLGVAGAAGAAIYAGQKQKAADQTRVFGTIAKLATTRDEAQRLEAELPNLSDNVVREKLRELEQQLGDATLNLTQMTQIKPAEAVLTQKKVNREGMELGRIEKAEEAELEAIADARAARAIRSRRAVAASVASDALEALDAADAADAANAANAAELVEDDGL